MTSHTPSLIERLEQPSHTSGPWSIDGSSGQDIVFGDDGMPVAHAIHRENWPADARLIAAAPDLLKALTHCQRVLADLVGGDKSLSTINIYAQAVEAELKARAALASAKGSAQP